MRAWMFSSVMSGSVPGEDGARARRNASITGSIANSCSCSRGLDRSSPSRGLGRVVGRRHRHAGDRVGAEGVAGDRAAPARSRFRRRRRRWRRESGSWRRSRECPDQGGVDLGLERRRGSRLGAPAESRFARGRARAQRRASNCGRARHDLRRRRRPRRSHRRKRARPVRRRCCSTRSAGRSEGAVAEHHLALGRLPSEKVRPTRSESVARRLRPVR